MRSVQLCPPHPFKERGSRLIPGDSRLRQYREPHTCMLGNGKFPGTGLRVFGIFR